MDKKYKKDLHNLIVKSRLNESQKLLWELFLKISNPEEDEAVFEAADESNDNLELLTQHLRDKIWDMKQNDQKAWLALVGDAEKYARIL